MRMHWQFKMVAIDRIDDREDQIADEVLFYDAQDDALSARTTRSVLAQIAMEYGGDTKETALTALKQAISIVEGKINGR